MQEQCSSGGLQYEGAKFVGELYDTSKLLSPTEDIVTQPSIFTAMLEKPSLTSPLGLHVDLLDERLLFVNKLLSVHGGRRGTTVVQLYNKLVPKALQVQQGDYIQQVNGTTGAIVMREALRNDRILQLVIQRPILFQRPINMQKGQSLGLDLNFGDADNLPIASVDPSGIVALSAPDVKPGDRIVSVNGMQGDASVLIRNIQDAVDPVLGFSRAPWSSVEDLAETGCSRSICNNIDH